MRKEEPRTSKESETGKYDTHANGSADVIGVVASFAHAVRLLQITLDWISVVSEEHRKRERAKRAV